jgi:BirA family transcriptional regulator, biotin operon repressor / biotin---[acetyl-CoA-carboxylase] ligase
VTVDSQILRHLRASARRPVSGEDLAESVGLSLAALCTRVKELRALGYEIEASPHLGYRLVGVPDVLHADDLLSRLGKTGVVGRDIQVFQETTSTNDVIERLARDGVKEGAVVFAETQTKGRGRLGRKWASPAGKGLWFSVLLRPNMRPELVTQFTVAAATALSRAIRAETDLRIGIKWPNDILLGTRKIAGILTELSAEVDRVKHVTVGIGVDVNIGRNDFPPELESIATSLAAQCGRPVDRAALATAILRELDLDYTRIQAGHFEALADEWEAQSTTLGHEVVIRMGDREVRGRAESLDAGGALLVRTHHGHLERIYGGDVTLEK